jgi:CMP-N-acetylneuraminic acid synthetase
VIPARGGSKGIPRKNLAPLAGRPLIAYTIDAARASERLTRLVVSTDDEEIAGVARSLGADVPFLRPVRLAADDAPMFDVLQDALCTLRERETYEADVLVLLQPTSPFRRAEHIDAAVDLLVSSGADSVVSVVAVPHQFTPSSLMTMRGSSLVSWQDGPLPSRRQDKPELFARNGPAVVALRPRVLTDHGTLYGENTRALVMRREESLDIDDAFDLKLAELLIAGRPS